MPYRQSENEIIKKLKKYAESYTPEWRFDEENPDAGTALGLIFSEMHTDTLQKFEQLPRKNMLEFFKYAGTELVPANPAEGYVAFGLVNRDVEGIEVPKETGLLANDGSEKDSITFETVNDVYVTPSVIYDMVQVLPQKDGIYSVYERNLEDEREPENIPLFKEYGSNLQEHILYLAHETLFYIEEGCIILRFEVAGGGSISEQLSNSSCMRYEYYSREGYIPFERVESDYGSIRLYKGKAQPMPEQTEYAGKYTYWIRMSCFDIDKIENFGFTRIFLSVQCPKKYPDFIFAGGLEQQSGEYFPFGEQMGIYECVYFSSNQVLKQKSAKITLSFRLNFTKIPLETYGQQNAIDWKMIMKRTDFIPEPEYDIDIAEVTWEYFNGYNWRKLPESDSYAKVFTPDHGMIGRRVEISFFCPEDLQSILVDSVEACYIRARIIKMRNLYRWNGKYVPPILSDTSFSYEYRDPFPVPELLISCNNLETRIFRENELRGTKQVIFPYMTLKEKTPTLYLGFDKPIEQSLIRIWLEFLGDKNAIGSPIVFEYFCKGKWKLMNIIDDTEGFRRTGILTLLGNKEMTQTILWGKERFWIRITAEDADKKNWSQIVSLYMNVTEICAIETQIPEYFLIESNEKNIELKLTSGNVYEAQVWVREYHDLTKEQLQILKEKYEVMIYPSKNGASREIWTCWKEVSHFTASGPEDYHYKINKIDGVIQFSDGIHGKIPYAGIEETIKVLYKCGGGRNTNLPIGAVSRLRKSVGFINRITNVKPTVGGSDSENITHAVKRSGQAFRHKNRAVTVSDYEALALEADSSIAVVKCYSNYNQIGEKCRGHIVLILLLENHKTNPDYFFTVKSRCIEFFKSRVYAGLIESQRLHIIPPEFVEISVHAAILVKNMNFVMETRHRCLKFLYAFLDPLTGNFDGNGWKFGYLPNQIQLQNALHSVTGVSYVDSLNIVAVVWKNGKPIEVDLDEITDKKFVIVTNGTHEIDIRIGG